MTPDETRTLGKKMLHHVRFLQVVIAVPTVIYMAHMGYLYWSHEYDIWFWFSLHLAGAFMAAGIVFIVSVQSKEPVLDLQTLFLEGIKAFLATLLWRFTDPFGYNEKRTILATTFLVIFFYIPLAYAYWARESRNEWRRLDEDNVLPTPYTGDFKNSPLLKT
ncbi:hypothetical protein GQ44DRAFT_504736 [Phaeosphaeriaceae sp. PMI808]|nr:hypothetical protein GQ44DRAFT_504736 [Phaeosphaeriaceae sp. PMI808]